MISPPATIPVTTATTGPNHLGNMASLLFSVVGQRNDAKCSQTDPPSRADVRVAGDPEAPRLGGPFAGIIDAAARTDRDRARRHALPRLDPDTVAQQVRAVERSIDAERDAELPGPAHEVDVRMHL